MGLREMIRQSLQALLRNRLRSGLTMLGIIWGLVTVVLLLSYGNSLGSSILRAFLGIGNNVEMVWGGQTSMQAGGQRSGKKIKFKYEDIAAIQDGAPLVKAVSPETDDNLSFKYGTRVVNISSKAVEYSYGTMRRLKIAEGRYFEPNDFTQHRKVVIFGPHASAKLFSGMPAVGESILIEGHSFQVIGILALKIQDSSINGPDNENAFIPFDAMRDLRNQRDPHMIVFQAVSPELHKQALGQVRAVLAEKHHFDLRDDKAAPEWDTVEDAQQILQFSTALEILLGIIGALTLGVGGVGVMNIMLVSVTERTHEIGLMKALGARKRDILRQFLVESLTLTMLAGFAGAVIAVLVAHLVPPMPLYSAMYKTANHEGDIVLQTPFGIMVASFLILALVGVDSGMIPAMRAARMDPIVALHHE